MSMMPAAIVSEQPSQTEVAETPATAVSLRAKRAEARRMERDRTRAILADFEAHLNRLETNPPSELSPVKLMGVKDSIQHTIADLRRQLGRRKTVAA